MLSGHSTGGLLACELASRLQHLGAEVSALILLDSLAPALYRQQVAAAAASLPPLQGFAQLLFHRNGISLHTETQTLAGLDSLEQLRVLVQARAMAEADLSSARFSRLYRAFCQAEALDYHPEIPADVPVTLIRATAPGVFSHHAPSPLPDDLGWATWVDRLSITSVAADHYRMLSAGANTLALLYAQLLPE